MGNDNDDRRTTRSRSAPKDNPAADDKNNNEKTSQNGNGPDKKPGNGPPNDGNDDQDSDVKRSEFRKLQEKIYGRPIP